LKYDIAALVDAVEKKYRVMVGTEWYAYVGNAMNTPVSDGERVARPHTWHGAEMFLYLLEQDRSQITCPSK
jgi:hypothetical protein